MKSKGFSLIEMLVSALLLAILTLVLLNYLITSRKSNESNNLRSDLNQSTNVVAQFLQNSLRQVGYVGTGSTDTNEFRLPSGATDAPWTNTAETTWRNLYYQAPFSTTIANALKETYTPISGCANSSTATASTGNTTPAIADITGATGESRHLVISWVDHINRGSAQSTDPFTVYIHSYEIWRDNTTSRNLMVCDRMFTRTANNTVTRVSSAPLTLVSNVADIRYYYQTTTGAWQATIPTPLSSLRTVGIYFRVGSPNPKGSCKSFPSDAVTLGLPSGKTLSDLGLPTPSIDTGSNCSYLYQERVLSISTPNLTNL